MATGVQLPTSALELDDDGYAILGNALLLGYLKRLVRIRLDKSMSLDCRAFELKKDMEEVSERTELRDVLDNGGALDDAIYGPVAAIGISPPESLIAACSRWHSEMQNKTKITLLRFKDIAHFTEISRLDGLQKAVSNAHDSELRLPIWQLEPNELTRCLLKLVMSYFRDSGAKKQNVLRFLQANKALGGPRSSANVTRDRDFEKALLSVIDAHPDKHLTKAVCLAALQKQDVTQSQAQRIWSGLGLGHAGRPSPSIPQWTEDQLKSEIDQAIVRNRIE